jgi:hypothetical protein
MPASQRLVLAVLFSGVLGCDLPPLTTEALEGTGGSVDAATPSPSPDARVDAAIDAAPDPMDAAIDTAIDTTPTCSPSSEQGVFSGQVLDACDPAVVLDAHVGIAGKHTCAFANKGSFFFSGLPVGCALTVTATRIGYLPYQDVVAIPPGGRAGHTIRLEREAGCASTTPTGPACRCDEPGCVAQ